MRHADAAHWTGMAKGITEQRRFGDGGSQQRLGLHCKMKWEDVRFTAG